MDEEEPIKVTLTVHPAFTRTVPLPLAVLCYNDLGLNPMQAMYLVHMLAALLQGKEINTVEIAEAMGVKRRTLTRYNAEFKRRKLLDIKKQFEAGLQVENSYSMDGLLNHLMERLEASQRQEQARLTDIAVMMNQLLTQLEEPDVDPAKVLAELVERWKLSTGNTNEASRCDLGSQRTPEVARCDLGSQRGGDLGSQRGGDLGSQRIPEVAPLRSRIAGNDDDDLSSPLSDQSDHHHPQQPVAQASHPLVDKLIAGLGCSNSFALALIARAVKSYGKATAIAAVGNWLAWVLWKQAKEPAYFTGTTSGFMLTVISNGQQPPAVPIPADRTKQHIPDDLKHIIKR